MPDVKLTLSCGTYEITRPLLQGEVSPSGVELVPLEEDTRRIVSLSRHAEADIAELNITEYFRAKEAGRRLIAIPVFPHRRFREGYFFVRSDGEVRTPRDVIGRRGGISGFGMPAAGVWMRGILQDHHDVPLDAVQWLLNPTEPIDDEPARQLEISVTDDSLLAGDIDLLITPRVPKAFETGDPRIVRLFRDEVAASLAYYRETQIFPIMHVVTVRHELTEDYPWLADSLLAAFDEAKRIGFRRAANPRLAPLAFYEDAWERQLSLLGPDPWEYGLGSANANNLKTIIRYCVEQGRITYAPDLSDLFATAGV